MAKFRGVNKDVAAMLEAAQSQGFRVERTDGGHYRVFGKNRQDGFVTVAGTPSKGKRSIPNTRSLLRRLGVAL